MTAAAPLRAALGASLLLTLFACNDDEDGAGRCAARAAPLASAGADQAVPVGALVSLHGQGSASGGAAVSFQWDLASTPPGSAATLQNATTATPSFVADVAGAYVGLLTVSDGCATSDPDVVVVTAGGTGGGCGGPNPVANAGIDREVPLRQTVTLDGTGSVSQRGLALTYVWTLSRPAGSAAVLAGAVTAHPTFVPDLAGTYVASLVVSDGCGASTPDTVAIAAANRAPVAAAGPDRSIPLGVAATVNGAGSIDPDGDALTFEWTLTTRPEGSAATLPGGTSSSRAFTPDVAGDYVLTLVVTDGVLTSAPDTVKLTATNLAPVADAGLAIAGNVGVPVQLDGSASFDPNGTALTYAWALTARPPGSAAALAGETSATPTFVPDVVGTYVAALQVSDGALTSAPDTVTVAADGQIAPLGRHVVDAEFSTTLDRIVMVSESPHEVAIHDPGTGAETTVALPLPPQCVSVTPDGLHAAVGHAGLISWIDLRAGTLVKTLAVSADVFDVVAGGNGYVYAFPRVDQWEEIHTVEVATGTETLSGIIRAGTRAKLHPGGIAIYGADNGLSPSDIEKYSIAAGTAQYLYDSPYHGDYAMCGNLWIAEDGARIFTACGNVFRSSSLQAEDMRWTGTLAPTGTTLSVRWASDSIAANEIVVLPGTSWYGGGDEDTKVHFHERSFMARTSTVSLPRIAVGGRAFPVRGRFVFHAGSGQARFVLVQVDAAAGLLADYALVVF